MPAPLFEPYPPLHFEVVRFDDHADLSAQWAEIQHKTGDLLTDVGANFLAEGLNPHLGCVLIERPYVCEDFRNLYQHFYSRKFRRRVTSHCARLHFFNRASSRDELLFSDAPQIADSYIGYCVVEPLASQCIGRTVLNPTLLGLDPNHVHCLVTWFNTRVGGRRLSCQGFPFRSQTSEATVCAHVTLWSVCRFLSTKFDRYAKLLPFDLIQMAGRRNGRVFPYHGMNYADYSEILNQFGCHPLIVLNHGFGPDPFAQPAVSQDHARNPMSRLKTDQVSRSDENNSSDQLGECPLNAGFEDFRHELYTYIESGFPLLATFGSHVVCLIGHESLPDEVVQQRLQDRSRDELIHAADLVDRYIVMDDNRFPYQPLPLQLSDFATAPTGQEAVSARDRRLRSQRQVRAIVAPLADEVYLRPIDVAQFVNHLVQQDDVRSLIEMTRQACESTWSDSRILDEPLVYRPFLTPGVSLKRFKQKQLMKTPADGSLQYQLRLSLPRFVWCVELSTPSLRQRDRDQAFAMIILDATAGQSDLEPLYIQFGTSIAEKTEGGHSVRLDWCKRSIYPSFAQYRHNLGDPSKDSV